jgi:eukaryotic-like serine/threonine-protein kinase
VVDTASMSPERWHHISEIAADCLAIEDAELREQHLLKACADDAALALAVRDILQQDAAQGNPLHRTAMLHAAAQSMGAQTALAGARLGPWQLDAEIARGGMGTVYRAHRADGEYAQDVAIKLVRADVNSQQVVDRFHAERQILASLAHPNIARLIDGGTRAEGTPYLVMEYVDGESIIAYATRHQLDIAERLQLFRTVCAAVHFAHQRLVVHRDLKPSNIFVTHAGEVKLLDFGIAKVLESAPAVDGPAQTTMLAMTPAYASPEQVKGETVTTASDVYALGVVLYELLTGQSPYKSKTTQPLALAKEIVDTEPERPSQVAERADDNTPALKKLRTGLRAELDNIVLMALRKEPARRYSSAEQLSDDIQNYLQKMPVIAQGDTFGYRSQKFISRNRWAVSFASVAALGLAVGAMLSIYQAGQARAAQARAERHFASVRKLANGYLFDVHDAIKDLPGATGARELLVKNSLTYLDQLAAESDDVVVRAEVAAGYEKLADVQGAWRAASLGDTAGAEKSFRRAIELRERLAVDDPMNRDSRRALVSSRGKLSELLMSLGKHEEAIKQGALALGVSLALAKFDDATVLDKLNVARGRFSVATHRIKAQGTSPAQSELNQALKELSILRAQYPDDIRLRRTLVAAHSQAALLAMKRGELDVAVEWFSDALKLNDANRAAEPSNPQLQRMHALVSTQLAEAQWRRGAISVESVLSEQQAAMQAVTVLAKADSKNQRYATDVSMLQQLVADKLARLKQFAAAVTELDAAIAVAQIATDKSSDHATRANFATGQQQLASTFVQWLDSTPSAGAASERQMICGRLVDFSVTLFDIDVQKDSESVVRMPILSVAKSAFDAARLSCAR